MKGAFASNNHSQEHTVMRTMITRTALFLSTLFSILQTRASEPATPLRGPVSVSAMERELEHQIDRLVSYPVRHVNMDGEVYVSFVVNAEGKVEVLSAHSSNDDLCAYVLGRLARIDIGSNPGGLWKTTHMRFTFHPEV